MKQQLQRMQEAIDHIRKASDEELHKIYLSLGAQSTKPQALSATYRVLISRRKTEGGVPRFGVSECAETYGRKRQVNVPVKQVVVATTVSSQTTTFPQPGRVGGLVA